MLQNLSKNVEWYRSKFIKHIVQKGPFFLQRLLVYLIAKPHIMKYRGPDNLGPEIFETVFFELRTRCNSHCTFCVGSVENEIRPDVHMPFEVFQKGIDNLKSIGFLGRVAFHITSEPLLSESLPKFIAYAREELPNVWLQLLTNGRKLNPRSGKAVLDAGINEITVNYYNDACAENPDLPLPKNIKKFENEVLLQQFAKEDVKTGHGPDPIKGFCVFRYNVNLRRETETLSNQTGSAPNKSKVTERNFLGFCHSPLTDFHITTDGSVSKCSKDVYFSDPMGNIMEQDILAIWTGPRFRAVHQMLLVNDRMKNTMCSGCDYPGFKAIPGDSNTLRRLLKNSIYSDEK
jgi:radical SAM protein with 4Fe4S-binding SPASM domain